MFQSPATISFIFFLLIFLLIGTSSHWLHNKSVSDYLIADRKIWPMASALSAVSTNNSAYMYVGMIAFTYQFGLVSIWLMFGWVIGDFIISLLCMNQIRQVTNNHKISTYQQLIATWWKNEYPFLKLISALVITFFLMIYAAAQLKAGGKTLEAIFGWHYTIGIVIGTFIIICYCFASGLRATIWTDIAQSFVMLAGIIFICFFAIKHEGGISQIKQQLSSIPNYLNLIPRHQANLSSWLSLGLFITGWLFAGFGVIGQPHVLIRFMASDIKYNIWRIRFYYYMWYITFFILVIFAGMCAKLILPAMNGTDAEMALPYLSHALLPGYVQGLVIAGLFAAIMSTTDSQLLSCSAAISQDIFRYKTFSYTKTKITTMVVALIALLIGIYADQSVFTLVVFSWATLASAFVPLIVLFCLKQKPSEKVCISIMITGIVTAISYVSLGFSQYANEAFPGISIPLILYCIIYFAKMK